MEAAQPHLQLVDVDTGELHCVGCAQLAEELDVTTRKLRGAWLQIRRLERDAEAEARAHGLWPVAVGLFSYWKERCSHPRSEFGAARFELVLPFLREHGEELCRRAIDGAAFDPFTTRRRNGSVKRHDGWELVFRSPEKFEEFACRAPRTA